VTSDQTHTEGAAARSAAEAGDLRSLIEGARVVLWDFDGPVCRLFARHSAERVAKGMVDWLAGRGLRGLLSEDESELSNPHAVLRAVASQRPDSGLVIELEARLTEEERRAASTAWPTPYADPLIRTWTKRGRRLAVATNNSPVAVRTYLKSRGLDACFTPHVYGRTRDLSLLKPNPYCLNRALDATGTAPSEALMIGDSSFDYEAAASADVPFLGYACTPEKARLLRESGTTVIVDSLEPVLRILRG